MRSLQIFADHVAGHPEYVSETLKAYGMEAQAAPDMHFVFLSDETYGILETHTGALFPLPGT